jgi:hypothetical protein
VIFNNEEMEMSETRTVTITERSTIGLREILFSEIDSLRNGETEPARAQAVAKLAQQILTSVSLELNAVRWLDGSIAQSEKTNTPPKLKLVG